MAQNRSSKRKFVLLLVCTSLVVAAVVYGRQIQAAYQAAMEDHDG